MKCQHLRFRIFALCCFTVFHIGINADAFAKDESFRQFAALGDNTLDTIRGGLMLSNGMSIDFALTTRTLVDGVIMRETTVQSTNPQVINPADLHTIIQLGENNAAFANQAIPNIPGLLTVIQNTLDNKTIQNFNILDVNATNVSHFKMQSLPPQLNYQTVMGLR